MPFLNVGRWLSALVVAYGHVFFLVYPEFRFHDAVLGASLATLAKLRYLAVVVFFVISGHLIGGGVLCRRNQFAWLNYTIHRFARIYVPLVPALLLTVLLDRFALNLDPHAAIYTVPWPTHVIGPTAPIDNYGFLNVIASVTSLESIIAPPLGSNAPLWSLGLEWCFYFLFPVIFVTCKVADRFSYHVVAVSVAAVILFVLVGDLAGYWMIWCSGALARRWLGQRGTSNREAGLAGMVAVLAIAASLVLHGAIGQLWFVVFGVCFAIILQNPAVIGTVLWKKADQAFADMSYSLYITHVPVAVFCVFLAITYGGMPLGGYPTLLSGMPLFITALTVPILVAWLFSVVFERRTAFVRKTLQAALSSHRPLQDESRIKLQER
jgi:peptidoglycan/LPS O-acetylase OafA/YrhL